MCGTAPRRGDVAADPVSTGLAPKLCLPPRLVPGTAGTGGLGMPLLLACAVGAGDGRGGLLGVGGSSLSSPPASVSLEAEASAAAALSVALTRRCRRWSARRCRGRVRVCGCVGVEEGGVLSPGKKAGALAIHPKGWCACQDRGHLNTRGNIKTMGQCTRIRQGRAVDFVVGTHTGGFHPHMQECRGAWGSGECTLVRGRGGCKYIP